MSEREDAEILAHKVLDRANADPDDHLAVLSRQLLRALERERSGGQKYPFPCGLCPGSIESEADREWHGLGNCVPICERCVGSGIEPDSKDVKDSYDRHAQAIIKNLAMLIRRLAYRHHNEKLKKQAIDYLLGEGLQGSILRDAP